jgi:ubiquinone/menaquinone biosynthesis C-methylase UbiE
MDDLESAVARHYQVSNLSAAILQALEAAGLDADRLKPADLAPIDEFHIGGRAATIHALEKLHLTGSEHVLDVGCGLGGATRYLADTFGCRVTGIDLTPEYIAVAQMLAERTGLADRIAYKAASALDMPFADATFDAAITLHVAMNIKDRQGLYREIARVLKVGAPLCIYDVMKGDKEGLAYPVPWAQTPATSHLETPQHMRALLADAGFEVSESEDRTDFGVAFFRRRLAAAAGGPPPLGTHLLTGATSREKSENMLAGLEGGAIAPVVMIARRLG